MIMRVLLAMAVPVAGILIGLLYKGIDRILAARMQGRVGPPVVQPFRDVRKLLVKENIVPDDAVGWLFGSMPFIALVSVMAILLYLPLGVAPVLEGYGDLILVLYLLIIPSLALVLGGFASSSPYASVGGQREMVKMMSYEFPLAIAVISVAWLLYSSGAGNVFSLSVISGTPVWGLAGIPGLAGLALIFLCLLFVIPGELGRVPFDVSEADSEIAGGIFAEYSGRNLALFYLADAVKAVAMASLAVALFLPYTVSGIFGLGGAAAPAADFLFHLLKVFLVLFVSSTVMRVVTGRLAISRVVSVYWKYPVILSFLGLLLIMGGTLV